MPSSACPCLPCPTHHSTHTSCPTCLPALLQLRHLYYILTLLLMPGDTAAAEAAQAELNRATPGVDAVAAAQQAALAAWGAEG